MLTKTQVTKMGATAATATAVQPIMENKLTVTVTLISGAKIR
jgi:hypothetical protein